MLMKIRLNHRSRCIRNLRSESGVALLVVLMATLLMTALGLGLVLSTSTETMMSSNFGNS
jgi:Tfp pilus assembly protein PilX